LIFSWRRATLVVMSGSARVRARTTDAEAAVPTSVFGPLFGNPGSSGCRVSGGDGPPFGPGVQAAGSDRTPFGTGAAMRGAARSVTKDHAIASPPVAGAEEMSRPSSRNSKKI